MFLRWVLITALSLVVLIIGILLLGSPQDIEQRIVAERIAHADVFGEDLMIAVADDADRFYNEKFVDSGLVDWSMQFFAPADPGVFGSEAAELDAKSLFGELQLHVAAIWLAVYFEIQRFTLILHLLPYYLIVLIPAVVDGLVRREIKKYTFGYTSHQQFDAGIEGLLLLILLPVAGFLIPWTIHPAFLISWLGAGVIVSFVMAANLQKKI